MSGNVQFTPVPNSNPLALPRGTGIHTPLAISRLCRVVLRPGPPGQGTSQDLKQGSLNRKVYLSTVRKASVASCLGTPVLVCVISPISCGAQGGCRAEAALSMFRASRTSRVDRVLTGLREQLIKTIGLE
ncbi:hypothetical protein LIA77_00863 [Sarocladium implicatum]|nr:hypothetical protein LIA77_00863 [Sarocladium implicatum]